MAHCARLLYPHHSFFSPPPPPNAPPPFHAISISLRTPTPRRCFSPSLSLSLITFSSSFFSSTLPVPSNVHRCVYPTENSLPTRISLPTKLRFSSETVVLNRRRDSNMRLDKAPSPSVASGTCPRSLRRGILIYSSPV